MQKYAEENDVNFLSTPQGGVVLNLDNDESRRMVEHCFRTTTTLVNPITDWTDDDVWEFLRYYGCKSNPLYECKSHRIGCIGCPASNKKIQQSRFAEYPKFRDNYIRAFAKMLKHLDVRNPNWKSGVDVFRWWVDEENVLPGQTMFYTPKYLKDIPDELYKEIR